MFLTNIQNSLVRVIFFVLCFGFAAFYCSLIVVQRLVPPNGHRCLNFNFAEGKEKKKKTQEDLLASELCHWASLSVKWQGEKKKRETILTCLTAEENYLLLQQNISGWHLKMHTTQLCTLSLSESHYVCVSPPRLWQGCVSPALRVHVVQVRKQQKGKDQIKCLSTFGCFGNVPGSV